MFRLERRHRDTKLAADEIRELRNGAEFKEHLNHIFEIIKKSQPGIHLKARKSDKLHSSKEETIKDIVVKIYQVRFEDIEKDSKI